MPLARALILFVVAVPLFAQRTQKPPLHGQHWMAITGKPLGATAGAMMFQKGGNAVDAAAAMLAATCTMWDTLSWGGETQALIYSPHTKKVIGINALGVAPSGATADFYRSKELKYPPEYGPLAAVTPGTPGGLMTMVAEYGKLSLEDVLAPAIQMADGYPIEAQAADTIERQKKWLQQWPYSRALFLTRASGLGPQASGGSTSRGPGPEERGPVAEHDRIVTTSTVVDREGPEPGSIFRQPDLASTLRKLVETERQALRRGRSRKEAIYAAYDRFYKGDIAQEIVRSTREQGGLFTMEDLARWQVKIEEPVTTSYKGIDVHKLTVWTQGPVMLQSLNILENFDLRAMGFNSARYIHTVYQAMNLAFADRDFYYGDPYFPPAEPVAGLLSKAYAKERAKQIDPDRNDPDARPGDPYPYQNAKNPYRPVSGARTSSPAQNDSEIGTTTVVAADAEGWVVSMTPSGGWIPAVVAGRTGIGLSQRAQSFTIDPAENPYNVIEPGKRPHVTLTPTLAMKDGLPFLAFAVQGGDTQDQNLLQFFLNVVEFGMTPQQASEAPNFNSSQMATWLGDHISRPGRLLVNESLPPYVRSDLEKRGYTLSESPRTSGPINAIWFDREHGTLWGGSSNHGEDYGIAW